MKITAEQAAEQEMTIVSRAAFLAYVLRQDLTLQAKQDFIEWRTRGGRLVGRSLPTGLYALTPNDARDARAA